MNPVADPVMPSGATINWNARLNLNQILACRKPNWKTVESQVPRIQQDRVCKCFVGHVSFGP